MKRIQLVLVALLLLTPTEAKEDLEDLVHKMRIEMDERFTWTQEELNKTKKSL